MKIELKSGKSIEVDSIEDLQDLYKKLHEMLGEKIKIVKTEKVIIEKQSPERLFYDIYRNQPMLYPQIPSMPKPLEVWCGGAVSSS